MTSIRRSVHRPCLNTKVAVRPIEWLRSRLARIFQCVRRQSQRHRPVCQVESVIFFGLWSRPVVSRDSSSCSRRTTNSWAVTEQSNGCLSSFVVVVGLTRVCWPMLGVCDQQRRSAFSKMEGERSSRTPLICFLLS